MKIYKYPLADTVDLPIDWMPLCIRFQDSDFGRGPMLWVTVTPSNPTQPVSFLTIPTGGEVPDGAYHISSWETPDGLMFHTFLV